MEGHDRHSVVFLDLNSLGSVECQKTLSEYKDNIHCQFMFTPFHHALATLQKVKAENVEFGLILTNDHPDIDVLALIDQDLKGLFNKELILPPLDPVNAVHLAIGKARALYRSARIFIISNEELGDLESIGVNNLKFLSSLPSAIAKEGAEEQVVLNQDAPLKEFDQSLLENVTVLDYSGEHLTIAGMNNDLERLVNATGYKKESAVLPDAPGLKKWRADRKNIVPLGAPMSNLAAHIPSLPSSFAAEPAPAEETLSGGFLKIIEEVVNPHSIQRIVDRYSKAPLAPTRHILWSGIGAVEDALAEELISIGLTVSKQAFTIRNGTQRKVLHNIIGELPGENENEIVLFTAHLDSTSEQANRDPEHELAPGADDNCTGIAAVLLAARTIIACCNGRKPGRTVRFGLVNAEEIGMVGSAKYAATLDPSKVIAVLNADTLGYSGPPGVERHFEVHYGVSSSRTSNSRLELRSRAVCEVVRTMFGQLLDNQLLSFGAEAMQVYSSPDPAAGRSDHGSFHNVGIPAVVVSEDFFADEGQPAAENPAYHQNTDTMIDPVYTCSIARILTASLLNLSLIPPISDDANAFAAHGEEESSREQYLDKHQYASAAGIIVDAQRVRDVFGTYADPDMSKIQMIISYTEAEINDILALGVFNKNERACGCRRFEFLRDILLICGFPRAEAEDFIKEGRWKKPVAGFAGGDTKVYKTAHFAISYSVGPGRGNVLNDTSELVIREPGNYQNPNRKIIATVPASNIPSYVRLVAFWLERAHTMYVDTYGLRNPCNSAENGLVPAAIINTDFGAAYTLPTGFVIDSTLTPDMVCAVSVHEYFHMIQFEYQLYGTWEASIMEGGATYAEDGVADYLNRYLDESTRNFNGIGVLDNPNQSIYASDSRYKSCLFWRYIAEQESENDAHMKAVTSYKHLIDGLVSTSSTHQKLSALIKTLSWNKGKLAFLIPEGISIPGSQGKIVPTSESVFANYTLTCALYKIDMPEHKNSHRFQFSEWNEIIGMPEAIIPMGVNTPKKTSLADSNVKTSPLIFSSTVRSPLNPLGSSYHSLDVSSADAIVVDASLASGSGAVIQIVLLKRIDGKDAVQDIIRSWAFPYKQTFSTTAVDSILVVLTSTDSVSRALVQLKVSPADSSPAAQAFITNWNSSAGTHYHVPLPEWNYYSPDVSLLNDTPPLELQVVAHTNGNPAFSTYPTLRVLFTNSDNVTDTTTTWSEAIKEPIVTSGELFDGRGIRIHLLDSVKKNSTLLFILDHADTSSTFAFSRIPPAVLLRSVPASLKSLRPAGFTSGGRSIPNKHNFYETVPIHHPEPAGSSRLKFLSAPAVPSPPPPEDFLNVAAWFLGPRGENKEELRKLFNMLLDSHCKWREGYFPQDSPYITNEIKETNAYKNSLALMSDNAQNLVEKLRNSTPFFSCRYQGHMNWEMSAAGLIGYFATMLFNPNNVATEASPTTTKIEIDVGNQLCEMLGYKTLQGKLTPWGHITSCGSVANIEGMWAARNVRFLGKAVHTTVLSPDNPELAAAKAWDIGLADDTVKPLGELSSWEILNIPTDSALSFYQKLAKEFPDSNVALKVGKNDIQHTGMRDQNIVCFVPASRHYSWDKASALLGIGQSQLRLIPIDNVGRQSVEALEVQLNECLEKKIPVVMVVVVIGSTAQGSVDNVEKVLALRNQFRLKGLDFYIHADAAWGGYFCSMNFTHDKGILAEPAPQSAYVPALPLSNYVTRQLKALEHVDSITLDPHKSGWIQYPAGGLCYRNSAIRHLLAFSAPILFNGDSDPSVGIFGVEGSKPGAAVAAVYMHHQSVGLHDKGHGRLCGMANWSSKRIFAMLQQLNTLSDDVYHIVPLQPVNDEQQKNLVAIAGMTNTELRDRSELLDLLKESGSDLCINAYSINYSWPILALEGVTRVRNTELSKVNQLIDNIAHDLNITYTIFDDDPYKLRNVGRKGLWLIRETFDEVNFGGMDDFISRLGAFNNLPQKKLNYLVNTSMDPWPTAIGFLETYKYELRQAIFRAIGRINETAHHHGFVTTDAGGPYVFGNHLPVFHLPEHNYHGVALFKFPDEDTKMKFLQSVTEGNAPIFGNQAASLLYDFMFPANDQTATVVDLWNGFPGPDRSLGSSTALSTEVLIFEHFDPIAEYPEEPEFFLYGREGFAYISHCMAKFKDYHSVHQLSRVPVDVSPLLLRYGIKIKIRNLHAPQYVDVDPFANEKEWEFTFIGERGVPHHSVLTVSKTIWFDVFHLNKFEHHHH